MFRKTPSFLRPQDGHADGEDGEKKAREDAVHEVNRQISEPAQGLLHGQRTPGGEEFRDGDDGEEDQEAADPDDGFVLGKIQLRTRIGENHRCCPKFRLMSGTLMTTGMITYRDKFSRNDHRSFAIANHEISAVSPDSGLYHPMRLSPGISIRESMARIVLTS